MTALEFHYDFRILADEIEALANKSFNAAEIDWLLNRSQEQILRSRLNLNNVRAEGFEMDQKRIDDLSSLVVKYPEQPALIPTEIEDGHVFELELSRLVHPYYFFVRGKANIVEDNCNYSAGLKLVQHDDLNEAVLDPFHQSNQFSVLFNFGRASSGNGSSMYFYPHVEHQLTSVIVEYIKKPRKI
jgi:hypothetical protein